MEAHEQDLAYIREAFESCKLDIHPDATGAKMIPFAEEALTRIGLRDQLHVAGNEKIEKAENGIRLPIRKMLKALLNFYQRSRAAGHTWTMLNGAANTPGALIITRDSHAAEDIIRRLGREQISNAQVITYTGLEVKLAGREARPLAFDNWALSGLFEMSLDEFDRLGGEIKKAIADWHRFQDFIIGESPQEMFRLQDAGRARPNGVIEKFMAYVASLWKDLREAQRQATAIGKRAEELQAQNDRQAEIAEGFARNSLAFRSIIIQALDSGFGIDITTARKAIETFKISPELNEAQFEEWFSGINATERFSTHAGYDTDMARTLMRAAWNAARGIE